jgi:aspartate aminotransferase
MSLIAKRLDVIKPSPTIAVTTKARELRVAGHDIIGLGAGEPDFDTMNNIKQAAIKAIDDGFTKYTAVDGTPELKKAIQNKFQKDNDLSFELDQITVGAGGKQVIYNALMASINPEDEVIIPAPYWVSYPDIVMLAGGKAIIVECDIKSHFKITPEQLASSITKKTKWFILNSPSNPTGSLYSKEELVALGEVLAKYPQVNIMSDDIYENIIYDNQKFYSLATIIPQLKERILTINGVSKSYSMTGWRIGYAAGSKELIKAIAIIQSQSTSNPCSISQMAALEALTGDQSFLIENTHMFQERRNLVIKKLNKIQNLEILKPQGAFYMFPYCKNFFGYTTPKGKQIANSNDFAEFLLEDALVAVVPGNAFGMEGYFRLSYATSNELLIKACERITNSLSKLKKK